MTLVYVDSIFIHKLQTYLEMNLMGNPSSPIKSGQIGAGATITHYVSEDNGTYYWDIVIYKKYIFYHSDDQNTFLFFLCHFFGLLSQHMEIPRLGV